MTTPEPADLDRFLAGVRDRLDRGAAEYHHRPAATRPAPELVDEIAEELLDVCAWSFWLWLRVHRLNRHTARDPGSN